MDYLGTFTNSFTLANSFSCARFYLPFSFFNRDSQIPENIIPTNDSPSTQFTLQVRVIWYLEDHSSLSDREKNIRYLSEHYVYSRGDIILVEDDETKTKEKLNLSQIGAFKDQEFRVGGWDNHDSCLIREAQIKALNQIQIHINNLRSDPNPSVNSVDLLQLNYIAKSVQLRESLNFNSQTPPNKAQIDLLITSMEAYVPKAKNYIASKHFPKRQVSLGSNVRKGLLTTETGVIHVMTGKQHLDLVDEKVKASALGVLAAISPYPYLIV